MRCQELASASTTRYRFPEGLICGRCYERATHTHGHCPGCGSTRLLLRRNRERGDLRDVRRHRRDFHCHDALDALAQNGTTRHLRAILVELRLLQPRDESLRIPAPELRRARSVKRVRDT